MRRRRRRAVALGAGLALTVAVAAGAQGPIARDQHGAAHAWRGEPARVTVLDFAAAWCGPCWRTLPRLEQLARAHPAIAFVVVSVDDKVAGRDRLVEELELTLPVVWDEGHRIAGHYRPEAMPATLVVAPDGAELLRLAGSGEAEWRRLVELVERLDPGGD